MSEQRDTLRAIAWQEAFPALRLFSTLRMALNFRILVLSALALVLTSAGWQTCGKIFSDTDDLVLQAEIEHNQAWPWQQAVVPAPSEFLTTLEGWREQSPLLLAWRQISAPFERMYAAEATLAQFTYWLLCALWSLAVWAFFGGAITRIAAVSFARQENLSWSQVAGFVRPRWPSYFVAPLFPILGTFLAALIMAILGLAMRAPAGVLVGGILWPIVLLGGFMMAFLLIVLFFGWPLMWGAISAEGTDSFGALSHSYSYTYQRPLQYLLYAVIAALVGVLGWYLVSWFAYWIIGLSNWGISWGSGQERITEIVNESDLGTVGNWGIALIHFWNNCVRMLALAFIFSYFWTASTVIYFLLRRLVDATELDDVFMPEEHDVHGLPPLKTGPDGVAEAADDGDQGTRAGV
jgi:hypothetical protein